MRECKDPDHNTQEGANIKGVVSVIGTAELGCPTNKVWLFDHPTNTPNYYTAAQTPLPTPNGSWQRLNLCTGAGDSTDLGKQHEFMAVVVTGQTSENLLHQIAAVSGQNSAFFLTDLPAVVAQSSVTTTITALAPHDHC